MQIYVMSHISASKTIYMLNAFRATKASNNKFAQRNQLPNSLSLK